MRLRSREIAIAGLLLTLLIGGHTTGATTDQLVLQTATPEPVTHDTLEKIRSASLPPRDPVDLGQRLLGIHIENLPTPPPTMPEHQIGDRLDFNAVNDNDSTAFTVTATLRYKTPHVYVWFQVGFEPDMTAVKHSTDTFETKIYPTVHQYFGSEASPGIDGDVHLYILHARNLGKSVGGYFDIDSEYPKAIVSRSNEHEMFFVNLDTMTKQIGQPYYESVLAHEFQHMVHANVGNNQASWIDEGLAELSASLNGYRDDLGFAPAFLKHPERQLNTWPQIEDSTPNYGAAFLFTTYFLERFGPEALKTLETDPSIGLDSVADALRKIKAADSLTSKPVTVEDFYADWTIANLVNAPIAGDQRYAYQAFKIPLPTPQTSDLSVGVPQTLALNQWGTLYLRLATPGRYTLSFKGTPTVAVIPTTAHSGRRFWWSNRSDRLDSRLTHRFDLSGVSKATLSFWTWYALENNWDYSYVEVSTDDGKTWTALNSQDSVPIGSNNAYGPGYTGYSGGAKTAETAQWRHENIDLSRFAGKQILVRFECLTDAAVNKQGVAIDDITIPEIHYNTDAESDDGGWTAQGWVRIDNVLPQRYILQMVELGLTSRLTRLLTPDSGTAGTWTLQIGGDTKQIVLAVSGLTEYTTEPAQATLSIQPLK